ncbi:hypothetical protein LTR37_013686 [Vermiconidia calcicola]|uniref:Uncharacterized protein n=1 Tax=Vermiconidia calcicola TaxID=1690605 RepID=A0ACC3MVQ6_9PEZI|nr:hypothetical protein LTR37_013686 [Vermiconidia calcicola]
MAEAISRAGSKRPHSEAANEEHTNKKRRVRRRLQHLQVKPQHIEPAPQDPVFVQGQLMRSIGAALALAGFDSVKPTALEMFRSHVEEYMTKFLHNTRTSMHTSRRNIPTAQDFASALALTPNTSSATLLKPQLALRLPASISTPHIPDPDPPPAPTPDFSALLAPLIAKPRPYIPKHFPQLPPRHAWEHTPVYPAREKDARKMRERATEEGILAEQALRKLAAAAKVGAVKAEKRRLGTLSGEGRKVVGDDSRAKGGRKVRREIHADEEMFGEMMKEVGGEEERDAMDLGTEGVNELREEGVDVGMPEGVVVNWDMGGWRRGGKRGGRV